MRIVGILLTVTTCCGATEASAQFRAFVNVGGPGSGNAPAPGSAGLGTAGLGLGGFGSATENLGRPGSGDAGIGSSPGLSLPLLNQGAGNGLGVTGNATGTAQGSLSSAIDRPSSPVDSVTNSLMGPLSNAVSMQRIRRRIRPASESRTALPGPLHRVAVARPSPPRSVPPRILDRFGAGARLPVVPSPTPIGVGRTFKSGASPEQTNGPASRSDAGKDMVTTR
jgi:hypothetical protein